MDDGDFVVALEVLGVEGENSLQSMGPNGRSDSSVMGLLASNLMVGDELSPLQIHRFSLVLELKMLPVAGKPALGALGGVAEAVLGFQPRRHGPEFGYDLRKNNQGVIFAKKGRKGPAGKPGVGVNGKQRTNENARIDQVVH